MKLQLTLRTAAALTAVVAVVLAILRHDLGWAYVMAYTGMIFILLLASLRAYATGSAFWRGFALTGWIYNVITYGPMVQNLSKTPLNHEFYPIRWLWIVLYRAVMPPGDPLRLRAYVHEIGPSRWPFGELFGTLNCMLCLVLAAAAGTMVEHPERWRKVDAAMASGWAAGLIVAIFAWGLLAVDDPFNERPYRVCYTAFIVLQVYASVFAARDIRYWRGFAAANWAMLIFHGGMIVSGLNYGTSKGLSIFFIRDLTTWICEAIVPLRLLNPTRSITFLFICLPIAHGIGVLTERWSRPR